MVTQIDPISTPPTPADPPDVFEGRASQVWGDLFKAVPQMNAQAQEIGEIGLAAVAAGQSAKADSDAALGYRNEARAARDAAQGYEAGASGFSAAAGAARAGAEFAASNSEDAAVRSEAAAATAGDVLANAVQQTSASGAAMLPEGGDEQRPATGSIPAGVLAVRGNSQSGADYFGEYWDRVAGAWRAIASRIWVVAKIQELIDAAVGFTILYPSGGTEAAPGDIAPNTRVPMANPFPGRKVLCVAEVRYNGAWGASGHTAIYSAGIQYTYFASAQQLDDTIVATTGANGLLGRWSLSGGAHPNTVDITTPLPFRVKVYKLKG